MSTTGGKGRGNEGEQEHEALRGHSVSLCWNSIADYVPKVGSLAQNSGTGLNHLRVPGRCNMVSRNNNQEMQTSVDQHARFHHLGEIVT